MSALEPQSGVYVALSLGIELTGNLERFLDRPIVFRPRRWPDEVAAMLGWGLKGAKSLAARDEAQRRGLPYLALEDGFLRSVELGHRSPPLSLALDDRGIYYDARGPSRLEALIAAPHSDEQHGRAEALRTAWRMARVSKYNHAREAPPPVAGPFVLAVDQTAGDASIAYGLASAASFQRMLEAALDEHPHLPVVLKVHPDVVAGRKAGHFGRLSAGAAARVTLLADDAHAPALLEPAQAVYAVTSQLGFEALLWGKPVRCFGMPFYAGWGLTGDELPAPERRRAPQPVTLADLTHAALVEYPRYIDPETLQRCEAERLVEWMGLQRRQRERFPPRLQGVGFANWKQPYARAFFSGSTLAFVERGEPPIKDVPIAAWGRPSDVGAELRVEDGFLRSVGLGADYVQPLSWVIDKRGMYYDASGPSDLENLLSTTHFDDPLLARAAALRKAIVADGITKYNVGSGRWQRPPGRREVVLVPGQVEGDASITWGAPRIRTNLALLQAVREQRPDAWVAYKPHPDVLARVRPGNEDVAELRRWCDEIVTGVPMHQLLVEVDEVQVLTSLAGFEALLRGKRVVCHGSPFYAGWGLTEDLLTHPRRTRRLVLDELVAGALVLYPTYVSRTSGAFTTPERALHELAHWKDSAPTRPPLRLRVLRALKRWRDRLRQPKTTPPRSAAR